MHSPVCQAAYHDLRTIAQDVTVPVIVLLTIVSSCVTDCNFNIARCPCNGPVREVSPHTDITLHYNTSASKLLNAIGLSEDERYNRVEEAGSRFDMKLVNTVQKQTNRSSSSSTATSATAADVSAISSSRSYVYFNTQRCTYILHVR